MTRQRASTLPSGRLQRMLRLGRLATGVAGVALGHGARELSRGRVPPAGEALLNPANARRVAAELSQMRGAVMKIGQLLSMEAGDLLPPELAEILAGLRDDAHAMPEDQLRAALNSAWGEGWRGRFRSFEMQPFAAASIGQVHAAVDACGRRLAIKVQYPGVRQSIDSDIGNVALLLKWSRLLPDGFELEPLLELARAQLRAEADYRLEARHLERYRARLEGHPEFEVPRVIEDLSGAEVLAMSFVDGESIERLAGAAAPLRDRLATAIVELCLREFLHWGLVQSDPNFANFLFDAARGRIGLLDFGALRINEPGRAQAFAGLLRAALADDLAALVDAALEVGYLAPGDGFEFRLAIADLVRAAAEPARHAGAYDFGASTLSQRLAQRLWYLRNRQGFERVPPADVLFLHRKLAGVFLLCARIHARVDVRACIDRVLAQAPAE